MNFYRNSNYIIPALVLLFIFRSFGRTMNMNTLLNLLYTIPGLLIAITFHEFAHAKVAELLGDDTPRNQGRVTLNPFKHIDLSGFIMLMFLGFGWGKPVITNPNNYNKKIRGKKAEALVAFAGPLINFIIVLIFSVLLGLYVKFFSEFVLTNSNGKIIYNVLFGIISVNLSLGIFNLIPLPPLDGSKVVKIFLPSKIRMWYENNEEILRVIFLIIWVTPLARIIITPIMQGAGIWILNIIKIIIRM